MKVCVACQAEVANRPAVPIREDRIIRGIRATKTMLGRVFPVLKPTNNELYVCAGCMTKHMERRRSFEKTMLFASIFAGIVVLLLLYSIISSGRFDAWAVVSAFMVAVFVLALPLFRYTPAIAGAVSQPPKPPPPAPVPEPEPEEPEERPERMAKKKPVPKKKR